MIRKLAIALCAAGLMAPALAQVPITTDSRIKTLVYNENDVYSLLTHYGYQSNIEFGKHEQIETISVGDRVAWQIIPAGQRLFIKALEEKAHTNMTVVTNKRAYQFDLRSSGRTPLHPSEELVYVVRFFYPDAQAMPMMQPPVAAPVPVAAAPAPAVMPVAAVAAPTPPPGRNFQYTLTGPDAIAPVRVYDDGVRTYLRFAPGFAQPVRFFVPGAGGQLQPVAASRLPSGELVLDGVRPQLLIEHGAMRVVIYNEAMPLA